MKLKKEIKFVFVQHTTVYAQGAGPVAAEMSDWMAYTP